MNAPTHFETLPMMRFDPYRVAHEMLLTFTSEDWRRYARAYGSDNWTRFRDYVLSAVQQLVK